VAATSAAYPQKGIPQKSGTSWLFRSIGTQPHGSKLLGILKNILSMVREPHNDKSFIKKSKI
jgi:hypothetical protein